MVGETNNSREQERSLFGRRFSRARFLRLVGTGTGLSLLPVSLAALHRPSRAQTIAAAAPEVSAILAGREYPIGIWWPPPPAETTVERYQQIAQAGFNFVIGGNSVSNDTTNQVALQAATASELRFLLTDRVLQNRIRDGATAGAGLRAMEGEQTPSIFQFLLEYGKPYGELEPPSEPSEEVTPDPGTEVTSASKEDITSGLREQAASSTAPDSGEEARKDVSRRIQLLLRRYKEYPPGNPALAGLNLFDEPNSNLFGILGFAREEVLKWSGGEQLPYINVWPSYASRSALGTPSYEEYLERYMSEVQPPFLCFDHYPLLSGTQITSGYFYNWAVIREYSLKFGVPSWVFIQSVDFDGSGVGLSKRRRPNEAELLWQVNVSLAYGAKGIQYFTYWTPDVPSDASIQFGEALVSKGGTLTPLYYSAQRTNIYLRVIGKALLPLTSESVTHAGEEPLPRGAEAFTGDDGWVDKVSGSPVILSRFRGTAEATERHLFVANRSFLDEATTDVKLSNRVSEVFELDSETGEYARVMWHANPDPRKLRLRIAPGGARLFLLRTN